MPNNTAFLKDPEKTGEYYYGVKGGKPSTFKEEAYIYDFINQQGRAPTEQEVGQWLSTQNPTDRTYRPDSTMGKMGWNNFDEYLKAQRYGQIWGPNLGADVPSNQILLTDENGQPMFRTNQLGSDVLGGFLNRGQYVENPYGFTTEQKTAMGYGGITPGRGYKTTTDKFYSDNMPEIFPADTYRKPDFYEPQVFDRSKYQVDNFQGAPTEVYRAQLQDYLTQKQAQDYDKIKDYTSLLQIVADNGDAAASKLYDDYMKSEKTSEDKAAYDKAVYDLQNLTLSRAKPYQDELEKLITPDKAKSILEEADSMLGMGIGDESLPLWGDVQGTKTGPNFMALYDQWVQSQEGAFNEQETKRKTDIEKRISMQNQPQGLVEPTGNERAEFLNYTQSLNLPGEYQNWMYENYNNLYSLWLASGLTQTFTIWLENYLAGVQ